MEFRLMARRETIRAIVPIRDFTVILIMMIDKSIQSPGFKICFWALLREIFYAVLRYLHIAREIVVIAIIIRARISGRISSNSDPLSIIILITLIK